jgi:hypothetical protein
MTVGELYQALGVSATSTRPVGEKMVWSIYECGLRRRAIGVRSAEIGM